MHGEVRTSHLDSISIRSVGEAWAEDVQGCCEFPCGVFNHQHGQSIAAIAGVSFSIHVNHSVAVNVVAYLVIGRDEHSVLRALTNQHKLLNGTIAIHVAKVNGPWRGPWVKDGRSLTANAIVIAPSAGESIGRNVAGLCCRVAVRISLIWDQQVGVSIKIVVENGSIRQRENGVVVVAVPAERAVVCDGAVACGTRRKDVKVLITIKIADDGPLTDT